MYITVCYSCLRLDTADHELTAKQSANAPCYCSGMYLSAFQADANFVLIACCMHHVFLLQRS